MEDGVDYMRRPTVTEIASAMLTAVFLSSAATASAQGGSIPRAPNGAVIDLDRGFGVRRGTCRYVTFGLGVKPRDLDVTYVPHNSFQIAIKGTQDSLLCKGFYSPALRQYADSAVFVFADGTKWTFDDIDRMAQVRARATAPGRNTHEPQATAPASSSGRGSVGNKCVLNGGVTYTDGPCPAGSKQESAAENAAGVPQLQPGLWKITGADNREHCGDPLEKTARDVSRLDESRKMGCTVRTSSGAPRTYTVVVNCPQTVVSPDGSRSIDRGQASVSISSPNPQSFTMDTHLKDGRRQRVRGVRIGEC
jgi:hypothetical protein